MYSKVAVLYSQCERATYAMQNSEMVHHSHFSDGVPENYFRETKVNGHDSLGVLHIGSRCIKRQCSCELPLIRSRNQDLTTHILASYFIFIG